MARQKQQLETRITNAQKTGVDILRQLQSTPLTPAAQALSDAFIAINAFEKVIDNLLPSYRKRFPDLTPEKKQEFLKVEAETRYNLAQTYWESSKSLVALGRQAEAHEHLNNAIEFMRLVTPYYASQHDDLNALDCIRREANYTLTLVENLMQSKNFDLAETRVKDIVTKQLEGAKLQRFDNAKDSQPYHDVLKTKANLLLRLGFSQKALREYQAADQTLRYSYKAFKTLSEHPLHSDNDLATTKHLIKSQLKALQPYIEGAPDTAPPTVHKRKRTSSFTEYEQKRRRDSDQHQSNTIPM